MYDVSNISEEMARHFDFLKEEIKIINDNQVLLKDYLLKLKANKNLVDNEMDINEDFLNHFKTSAN